MPRSGDRGGGQKETSDVGCGGPLPLANHDSISPTTFALCVDTFSDRAKSLSPRTADALRISCASPPGDFAYTHHFAKAYIIGT
jgi:hypothetical protein